MKLPLQITFRDMIPLPSIEPEIRHRADKLDQWTSDVMSCHVTVQADDGRRRTGHAYRVQILVRVPDEEIAVGMDHADEDIHRAVRDAFDATDRRVEDYVQRRRGQTKAHHIVLRGRICMLTDDGEGAIVAESGETFHFDRTQVAHPTFEQLAV
ncbi:MAG: HPF/RaiA family ribosome-associated protein, partial [Aquincola sp.]|nr:HPF/RaiA family ribosome-associated protein [Aquincola sp.]